MNYDCTDSPSFALHYITKHCIKRVFDNLHRDECLSLFQFCSSLAKCKNLSNFHFDLSFNLSQGDAHDVSGEVQTISGKMKNDVRGGAHLPKPPLKLCPCLVARLVFSASSD